MLDIVVEAVAGIADIVVAAVAGIAVVAVPVVDIAGIVVAVVTDTDIKKTYCNQNVNHSNCCPIAVIVNIYHIAYVQNIFLSKLEFR